MSETTFKDGKKDGIEKLWGGDETKYLKRTYKNNVLISEDYFENSQKVYSKLKAQYIVSRSTKLGGIGSFSIGNLSINMPSSTSSLLLMINMDKAMIVSSPYLQELEKRMQNNTRRYNQGPIERLASQAQKLIFNVKYDNKKIKLYDWNKGSHFGTFGIKEEGELLHCYVCTSSGLPDLWSKNEDYSDEVFAFLWRN